MVITLNPELETAVMAIAREQGLPPETVVLNVLHSQLLGKPQPIQAQDDWERGLLEAARNCGVSLSNSALSSDGLYE